MTRISPGGTCQLPPQIGKSANQLWRFEGPVTLPDAQLGKHLGFNKAGDGPIGCRHTAGNESGGALDGKEGCAR
jgi:hypothetical protein